MPPIVTLLLTLILDYIAKNADSIVAAIKEQFLTPDSPPEVVSAIQELGYAPSEENLTKLHDVLVEKGTPGDAEKLAKILVNNAQV